MEGRSFPRAIEIRGKFFYYGNFYQEFERNVKKRPCKQATLSLGALLGKL
jgi:hypothetical protein